VATGTSTSFYHEGARTQNIFAPAPVQKTIFIGGHLCLAVVKMIHPTAIIHPQAKLGANVPRLSDGRDKNWQRK
jgi:hypothetical protein